MAEIKDNNVPEIRFKGFDDVWERRKFLDNIESITDFRGRTPKKIGMDWSNSGYLALSALNVKNGYIDFSSDPHYGDEELYQKWMGGKELIEGQVLFTTEAPMGNVAQVPDDRGYILSQRTIAFNVHEKKITNDFLATLLRTPKVFDDLTSLSSGGTAKGVSQKSLAHLNVVVPKDIDEQEKIGEFFRTLDDIIAIHKRKLDGLRKLKKAYLQQMFPQAGETMPRIRFDGFIDAWEQRELSEVTDFYSGLTYSPDDVIDEGGTFVLRSSNVQNGEIVDADNVYVRSDVVNCNNVQVGDIVVVVRNGSRSLIGKHAQVKISMKNTVIGAFMTGLRSKNGKFVNSLLDTPQFDIEITKNLGATINQITTGAFKKMTFFMPPQTEEWVEIGEFFHKLDTQITAQAQKVKQLQELKAAYLQRMFV